MGERRTEVVTAHEERREEDERKRGETVMEGDNRAEEREGWRPRGSGEADGFAGGGGGGCKDVGKRQAGDLASE